MAAAWSVHVRQGACGRGSGGGRSAAPCLGPARAAKGTPRVAAGLGKTAAAGVGLGGLRAGTQPRARDGSVPHSCGRPLREVQQQDTSPKGRAWGGP